MFNDLCIFKQNKKLNYQIKTKYILLIKIYNIKIYSADKNIQYKINMCKITEAGKIRRFEIVYLKQLKKR